MERGNQTQALGCSRGGLSTRVHVGADAQGQHTCFILIGDQGPSPC